MVAGYWVALDRETKSLEIVWVRTDLKDMQIIGCEKTVPIDGSCYDLLSHFEAYELLP